MIRTILFLISFITICATGSYAQSLEAFKAQLSRPATSLTGFGEGVVNISENGDAARAVANAAKQNQRTRVRGYRVCIYFDNGQNARAGAEAAKSLFEENFPGTRVYRVYDNPYFKVTVGNCLTAEEAIILKGKISGAFPKAFLKSEEFAISDLLN